MPGMQSSINTMHNGETVLHRVCKLNRTFEDRAHWDRIVSIPGSNSILDSLQFCGGDFTIQDSNGKNPIRVRRRRPSAIVLMMERGMY